MAIRTLPSEVAAQIAAGEVVERPASVVKELVENALDAGATVIRVSVKRGGIEGLQVSDNGSGIASMDAPLLFQRHATSKLADLEGLDSLKTLGFRGEALYSIGSVARVSLLTRWRNEGAGTLLEVQDGAVVRHEPRGAPTGTSVTVRGLFHSFPARLKFLKSPGAEASRVQGVLTLYALAYPEVRFVLTVDEREAFSSPGVGDLRETTAAVYGSTLARALLEVSSPLEVAHPKETSSGVMVSGLVSPPEISRANRSYITVFVNRRPVRTRGPNVALEQAYHGLLPQGRYPLAILNIALPPADVDVNVHPTKSEVRFRMEGEVFSAVQRAVRQALTTQAPVATLGGKQTRPSTFQGRAQTDLPESARSSLAGLSVASISRAAPGHEEVSAPKPLQVLPLLRVLGQVQGTYIVAEGPDGIYLIDQHAAHERVLFEQVNAAVQSQTLEVQGLLEPAVLGATPQQEEALAQHGELLARYGWQMEPFGQRAYLVRAMPSLLAGKGPVRALSELLDAALSETALETWEERLAVSLACHAAVRAGDTLSTPAMVEVVRLLEQAHEPHTCPHGRPTTVHLSASHLEREFQRR
ncbi:MAG: DNA mismatch repair endonuclease MutL [Chloroflexi bacterium]|nr:DNA mismatch repair endonuclease MutL [Chloroflexota bacterium]